MQRCLGTQNIHSTAPGISRRATRCAVSPSASLQPGQPSPALKAHDPFASQKAIPEQWSPNLACRSAGESLSFSGNEVSSQLDSGGPGDGNGSNGRGGGGGGGGGNGDGGEQPMNPELATMLAAAGRDAASFPADFAVALLAGKVTPEILKRWLELEKNFFVKLVWGWQGFRERLLGDPSFPIKVAIECGIGVVTKVTAEKTKREDNFWREIDFVAANVVMAILADFMLTWLPAPTLSYAVKAKNTNPLMAFFASCPDNAFQRVPSGMEPFTLGQRFGAILRNGGKLLGVGFGASMLGVGITNALVALRSALEPGWAPPNKAQDVLATSAAYGLYMSVSSNLRYQIIAGIIEERGIETIFKGQHQLCHILSFIVRTANTFVGSLLWVDFVRLLGMQKAQPKALPSPPAESAGKGNKKKGYKH